MRPGGPPPPPTWPRSWPICPHPVPTPSRRPRPPPHHRRRPPHRRRQPLAPAAGRRPARHRSRGRRSAVAIMSGTSVRGPLGGGSRAVGLRLLGRREDRPAAGDHPLAGGRHPRDRAHGRHRHHRAGGHPGRGVRHGPHGRLLQPGAGRARAARCAARPGARGRAVGQRRGPQQAEPVGRCRTRRRRRRDSTATSATSSGTWSGSIATWSASTGSIPTRGRPAPPRPPRTVSAAGATTGPRPTPRRDRSSPSSSVPLDLPEGTLTMLFTDIVDSTSAAERLGDQRWAAVLEHHDRTVRAVVAGHHGTVVKGSGDGYLIVFASARQAVLAAIAIQRADRVTGRRRPRGADRAPRRAAHRRGGAARR